MLKLANILMAAFLALAPGMDVVRLLHALEACGETAARVLAHHDHEHNDGQPCDDVPPQDCPHFKNVPHGSPAMAVAAPLSVILPAPPMCAVPIVPAAPAVSTIAVNLESRPPPGPPLVGCVKLLI